MLVINHKRTTKGCLAFSLLKGKIPGTVHIHLSNLPYNSGD